MAQSVPVNDFANAVNEILAEYSEIVDADVKTIVREVSKQAAKEVRSNIKTSGIKGTGAYKSSIRQKATDEGARKTSAVIYSKAPYYRLTHLLEYGHAVVVAGGRTPSRGKTQTDAFPHWTEAERNAVSAVERKLREALE